jgi:mannose-6-phosphate isomerase class I
MNAFRRTTQLPAPSHAPTPVAGQYGLYPSHPLPRGAVELGFEALAARLPGSGVVAIDGYAGVLWEALREGLSAALGRRGVRSVWVAATRGLRSESEIEEFVAPFLGGEDPIFGTRCTGRLGDFFDGTRWAALLGEARAGAGDGVTVVYGCGAALALGLAPSTAESAGGGRRAEGESEGGDGERGGFLVYVDLPKNELQFRARAGVPVNLGRGTALPPKASYKRSYFVDWPVLNAHKKALAGRVDMVVDGQRPEEPAVTSGEALRAGLAGLARGGFRVRPWFEPGPWGGQWCKRHIAALPPAPNYAWSFELIVPENGVVFRDAEGRLLEVSFDWLMFGHSGEVLGEASAWFGDEFPIRFDFLDTVEGGNLSVQVHPAPAYIREQFGERFTQDETYYILDAAEGATVNLGFQGGVDAAEFRAALERSYATATPLDVPRYVQVHPARRGDLFLIPHGTIHGAGIGSLVLEISATPYIFTFKLYDWLRPDLDGRPRPLNIDRGMANLDFARAGASVPEELISRPREVGRSAEGRSVIEELPTHRDHFYAVYRHRFGAGVEVEVATEGSVQVLSLVEGRQVELETEAGGRQVYPFAETFVVPAAAGRFRLRNLGGGEAVVVRARMKPRAAWPEWMT